MEPKLSLLFGDTEVRLLKADAPQSPSLFSVLLGWRDAIMSCPKLEKNSVFSPTLNWMVQGGVRTLFVSCVRPLVHLKRPQLAYMNPCNNRLIHMS